MQTLFPSFNGFTYSQSIPHEEGITRRDPTPVIPVDGMYHIWYSKNNENNPAPYSGYTAAVWHAVSEDGFTWHEEGEAVGKGSGGAFDACGVFTPTVLLTPGYFYLYYTAVPMNWLGARQSTKTAIGAVYSDSPFGPWKRAEVNPVLTCSDDPEAFDSLRVDDTCIIVRDGQYWMYYKGRTRGKSPGTTQMGLARAVNPLGPWIKYEGNPVLDSGHEVCVWPHGWGVGCLVCDTGPQGNTLQYSEDGIFFKKFADTVPPKAPGPYREDNFTEGYGPGISWGIAMKMDKAWPYLVRFDCDLRSPEKS
jgi:beta-xylosidase